MEINDQNDLDEEDLTNEEILAYWEMFPDDIKSEAIRWGVSDSVVGDNMYVWLRKKYKKDDEKF